ncbi:MAG TPA: pitrilysin family protein [Pyrinomonadaceae bacterium]
MGIIFERPLRRASALCLALLLAAAPAASQQSPPPQPTPATAGDATAASPAPAAANRAVSSADAAAQVTEFEVGGLKVLVKRRANSQTVVAGLFLRGGAQNVTAANAGVESLMLDVATEASRNFPRERLRKELARMGTGLGNGVNYDYSALTLNTTRFNFDRSWEIFTDVALRPSFVPEDFERVRNRVAVSMRNEADTPDSYLQVLQARAAYAGHPYLNDPRGNSETISRLTLADVRRYHERAMQTSRLLLILVGDVDPQMIRERVAATFGKLPRGDYRPVALPQLSFAAGSVEVTERALPTNYVQGVFSAPPLTSEDIYPMRIASSILQSRVVVEVRYKRNLSYAPDSFLYSQGANVGGIYVTSTDANQSVRLMLEEIARLQREPISADELQGTVQHFLTRHYLAQETNAAQAGELAQYELLGGGWRNAFSFLDRLRAVTPADVQRVAKNYIRNIRFVVIGDPKSVDKTIFTPQSGG